MEYKGLTIPASKVSANTRDIIQALARALPAATNQVKELKFRSTGDPVQDAKNAAAYVHKNFKYLKDGLSYQNIKLPSALIAQGTGDCKSFSLFVAAILSSFGWINGFRFASYGTFNPTHVYNFVESNGKKYTFDSCLQSLKESPRSTYTEDMKVQYIAGIPLAYEDFEEGIYGKKERQERRKQRRETRKENNKEGGKGTGAKRIALLPVRGAFLELINLNFRGLAQKLEKMKAKDDKKVRGFWLKLGGDPAKLNKAIDRGKGKKALFGEGKGVNGLSRQEDEYVGFAVATAAATASGALLAAAKLLKDAGIDPGDVIDAVKKLAPGAKPLGDFQASDPETKEAEDTTSQSPTKKEPETQSSFEVSPLIIGAGLVGLYFLTKGKSRK